MQRLEAAVERLAYVLAGPRREAPRYLRDPVYPLSAPKVPADPEIREAVRRGLILKPLPSTREEVEAIAGLFPQARTYLGQEATEERVKSLGPESRLIHFACHGGLVSLTRAFQYAGAGPARAGLGGLVLLHGFDRHSLGGAAWRHRVALAPQFHEYYVFTETFAFNLLMGREWPPTPEDLAEAAAVCRELGLGDLLDRMPSGLQQIVGESGWQLSHGERSRLFMARALLQRAGVVVLDESFAALDPENLQQALDCALRRAPSLLVIAHP